MFAHLYISKCTHIVPVHFPVSCSPLVRHVQVSTHCQTQWFSNCTVVSSVHITSEKSALRFSWHQVSLFSLLTSLISWQYAEPRNVQPSYLQQRRIVVREISIPFTWRRWPSWEAVASSSFCISSSIKSFTLWVIMVDFPEPGFLLKPPVSLTLWSKLDTDLREYSWPSSPSALLIAEGLSPLAA